VGTLVSEVFFGTLMVMLMTMTVCVCVMAQMQFGVRIHEPKDV
jgi:hypothetical protein